MLNYSELERTLEETMIVNGNGFHYSENSLYVPIVEEKIIIAGILQSRNKTLSSISFVLNLPIGKLNESEEEKLVKRIGSFSNLPQYSDGFIDAKSFLFYIDPNKNFDDLSKDIEKLYFSLVGHYTNTIYTYSISTGSLTMIIDPKEKKVYFERETLNVIKA